ncbi:hypothetical protein DCS_06366 [Drechmeria coniospora]|uniref:Cell wall protein n=1 Tax=Drechmeria coniospora TaxID=98403 RepID=A0A151GBC9_DRECN|nr:hypothetical protein DCS_06366 [Drechmeria coniospora]KYK54408.1 hypothetical protein DCS_06366 [Drechmeria coniospora]ODA77309.1 hypothetical protein RJ55_06936 [Drechmeria coniospora]
MKLSQVAILCLATGAYASAAVEERDVSTVVGILTQVQNGIDSLDASIKVFTSNSVPTVKAKSVSLVATIKAGISTVKGSSALTLYDTIALFNPVNELKAHAQTLANDLKAKRSALRAANQCDETRQQIADIKGASQALITAIVAKVPADGKAVAQSQANGITDVLSQAQANFSGSQCQNPA